MTTKQNKPTITEEVKEESYFQTRYNEIGFTPETDSLVLPKFPANPKLGTNVYKLIEEELGTGNIIIPFYTIEGEPREYEKKSSGKANNDRPRRYEIKRLHPKNIKKDSEGKERKYDIPSGAKALPWISPLLIHAYLEKRSVTTIVLIEGQFKAMAGYVRGLYTIGLSGVHGIFSKTEKGKRLHKDITDIIEVCGVKNVIILYDGDCRNYSQKDLIHGYELTTRINNTFFSSAKNFREGLKDCIDELGVELYFTTIKSYAFVGKPKGLDDLFIAFPGHGEKIAQDVVSLSEMESQYFDRINITLSKGISKLSSYLFLDYKKPDAFLEYHKEALQGEKFKLHGKLYDWRSQEDKEQDDPQTASREEMLSKYGFYISNGRYYTHINRKGSSTKVAISDFTMKLLYIIKLDESGNGWGIIKIDGSDKKTELVFDIDIKDLFNLNTVKAKFLVEGVSLDRWDLFPNILKYIRASAKVAELINVLGQQKNWNFFAFGNGIVMPDGAYIECDQHGVVTINNESFFIPSGKEKRKEKDSEEVEQKFVFKPGTISIKQMANLIFKIYGFKGYIGLTYAIASIHRDIIFNETRFFPFLFLYGGKGTGKSTFVDFLLSIFGKPLTGLTEESTDKGTERNLAQLSNNIRYIKEFTPSYEERIKNILKNAYDGVGYTRAQTTNDNKTVTNSIRSGLILDGNFLPSKDEALFSRLIFLVWEPKFTDETVYIIKELQDLLEEGNGTLFIDIYTLRGLFQQHFTLKYRSYSQKIRAFIKDKAKYTQREISHLAMMASVYELALHDEHTETDSMPDFIKTMLDSTDVQKEIMSSVSVTTRFFETLSVLVQRNIIRDGEDFKREMFDQDIDLFFVNYHKCYASFAAEMKNQNEKSILSSTDLKQVLIYNRSKHYEYANGEYFFNKKYGLTQARTLVFDVKPGTFELK